VPTSDIAIRLLVHRLSGSNPISPEDIQKLSDLAGPPRRFERGQVLVEQGDHQAQIWSIADGWALRQKFLSDGRRQIVSIMLPGELSEKGPQMPSGASETVAAASTVSAISIDREALTALTSRSPTLLSALFYEELTRHAITREWVLLHGRRNARERMAYFLYETSARLLAMGLIRGYDFECPLTQEDVADLLGLSSVHLNRTLQSLRQRGLVIWEGNHIQLEHPGSLARLAHFNPEFIRIAEEFAARAELATSS
jgi:CRP-like cAMP-binding protein